MHKLEYLVNSSKKSLYKYRHVALYSLISLGILFFDGCKKSGSITGKEGDTQENNLEIERGKIVDTYYSWSNRLIAQDYAGALSYCVPGSGAEGETRVHKQTWDKGGQSYDDLSSVEAWLTDEYLLRNYGEAVGNTIYYQYVPSEGFVKYEKGFYSSARKIDGKWKIDGFNNSEEVDWWK